MSKLRESIEKVLGLKVRPDNKMMGSNISRGYFWMTEYEERSIRILSVKHRKIAEKTSLAI